MIVIILANIVTNRQVCEWRVHVGCYGGMIEQCLLGIVSSCIPTTCVACMDDLQAEPCCRIAV
jgi:hypothetical protein